MSTRGHSEIWRLPFILLITHTLAFGKFPPSSIREWLICIFMCVCVCVNRPAPS